MASPARVDAPCGRLPALLLLVAAVLLSGCGPRVAPAPQAGDVRGAVPDLRAATVMVLPVQIGADAATDADAEIRYALRTRAPRIRWLFADEMQRSLDRSPGLDVTLHSLDVTPLLQAEVRRIGDPLFGQLRRLAALTNADLALIPVAIRSAVDNGGSSSAAELVVALVDPRDGRVRWFAVVAGAPGEPGELRRVATVAERLASALVP